MYIKQILFQICKLLKKTSARKKRKYKEDRVYFTRISFWYLEHVIVLFEQSVFGRGMLLIFREGAAGAHWKEKRLGSRGRTECWEQGTSPRAWGSKELTSGAEVHHSCMDVRALHTEHRERRRGRDFYTLRVAGDNLPTPGVKESMQ